MSTLLEVCCARTFIMKNREKELLQRIIVPVQRRILLKSGQDVDKSSWTKWGWVREETNAATAARGTKGNFSSHGQFWLAQSTNGDD